MYLQLTLKTVKSVKALADSGRIKMGIAPFGLLMGMKITLW